MLNHATILTHQHYGKAENKIGRRLKVILAKILLLILTTAISCKSQDVNFKNDPDLQNNLNTILSTFVKNELDIRKKYNLDKDKLILFVDVAYRDNLIRNSKIHLNIDFWSKEYADIYDAEFRFENIDVVFEKNDFDYIKVFNLKRKTDKEKNRTKKIVRKAKIIDTTSQIRIVGKALVDPFAQINIYLNLKNEITYIDLKDKIYYELLKDDIKFNDQFWDKIEIKQ